MKHVVVINDLSYVGRAALMANIPIISSYGHQVIPVPTVLLTRHTGFNDFKVHHLGAFFDQTIDDLIEHHQKIDAILIGYLDGKEQIGPIMKLLDHYPDAFVFVDPICADNGKFYHGKDQDYVEALKPLIQRADLIKPNITEALALCNLDVSTITTSELIRFIPTKLAEQTKANIVITGITKGKTIDNVINQSGHILTISNLYYDRYFPGTGDIFDSIVIATLSNGDNLTDSVKAATSFVTQILDKYRGHNSNAMEGAPFEENIFSLLKQLV